MPLTDAETQQLESELAQKSPALASTFREALAGLPASLSPQQQDLWAEQLRALSDHSLRSWEAGNDYFKSAPRMLELLPEAAYRAWVGAAARLAEMAAPIAAAYLRSSSMVVPLLAGPQVEEWARLGERLYKSTWKSISLASEFFVLSPLLLQKLSLADLARLVHVIEGISERSADLATACLESMPAVVAAMDHPELVAFIDFAGSISDAAWPEASLYFQRGPDMLRAVEPGQRGRYLDLSTRIARRIGRQAYALFAEGATALRDVPQPYHTRLIDLATDLVPLSPLAAMALVKSSPALSLRLRPDELDAWHRAGLEILAQTPEGGEAYFRLESGKAEQMLQELSARIELSDVRDLLHLYGKALTGTNVAVQPITALEGKGIGWVSERGPSTEGTAVYLPEAIEQYDSKAENFAVFKVYATHQTAHIEFGSFEFSFAREGTQLPRRRHEVESLRRFDGLVEKNSWLTDMERFFDLFDDRQLAADLFTVVEDLRVDSRVSDEYAGIRRAGRRVQQTEMVHRPEPNTLPLRQALVENLIRASLDAEATMVWPKPLERQLAQAMAALSSVRPVEALVEDAAEATLSLYELAMKVPNLPPEALEEYDWEQMTEDALKQLEQQSTGQSSQEMEELPEGDEMPYESPEQVDFRGDFKPELVQLLMRMRLQQLDSQDENDLSALSAEEIKELLEKSVEVDVDMEDFDMSAFEAILFNLEKETSGSVDHDMPEDMDAVSDPNAQGAVNSSPEILTFFYDEWDFRASDYKPRWCTVRERVIDEGTDEFYERALREHSALITETQRQFELMKPETFRKIKRLEDGEDIDLDAALDFLVQKRAGHGDVQKIYWRRNKIERDVAVAFLLDMSASTDEEIEKRRPRPGSGDPTDPRRYQQWLAQNRSQGLIEPPKRIIDLERESLVLLTRALEVIHDSYGIFGFSGYGRDNVEYFVIKDFNEIFSDVIRRRIDRVNPIRSTRMGPAIRHTTAKLMNSDAKAKILFLVSDGRPQDHGYGRDRTEKEYAIHDTHKALIEAKHKGIVPFALTVDKEGHDYLGQMCGDMAYEVLGDIELLPSRLPTLYRRLTE